LRQGKVSKDCFETESASIADSDKRDKVMLKKLRFFLFALSLLPGMAMAGAVEDSIVSQLKDLGFTQIQINRTWLGRSRIVAKSPQYTREIVVNPATGAILRDYWEEVEGEDSRRDLIVPETMSAPGGGERSSDSGDGPGRDDGGPGSGGDGGSDGGSGGGSDGGGHDGGGDGGNDGGGNDGGGGNDD
jgi:hypothetical protein